MIKIRKYKKEDRERILDICAETGFWGEPIDRIFSDRELFAKLIVEPYFILEPESIFVVEDGKEIVGYFLGWTKSNFEIRAAPIILKNVMKMVWKWKTGKYSSHNRNAKFLKWVLFNVLREEPKHPKSAHFHINLLKGYRGIGVGGLLFEEFEEILRKKGIKEYYGEAFSSNTEKGGKLMRVWERFGFKLYDKKESKVFSKKEIGGKAYLICVHKGV